MRFEQEKMIVGSLPSLYPLQKFEEEAINALVSLPIDDDTISRKAAIEAVEFGITYAKAINKETGEVTALFEESNAELQEAADRIKQLPPTQPAQTERKWILCNERMPEEHEWLGTKLFGTTISDEVYVTFENPKGERFCKELNLQNGKLSASDQSTIDAFYKGSKPIAWMPKELPEPYKGVTE